MKRITVDLVMGFSPCYSREHIEKLFRGRKWMLPTTVLKMDNISYEDKLWLLLRNDFLSDKQLRLFACDCAERSLPIFEQAYPDDNRPRKAVEVARAFANRNATLGELDAAKVAAWNARAVARSAARPASEDAAWAAARSAARAARPASCDAAWNAAWNASGAEDAEQKWQLERLGAYLREDK